jgi:hypothetical protein
MVQVLWVMFGVVELVDTKTNFNPWIQTEFLKILNIKPNLHHTKSF